MSEGAREVDIQSGGSGVEHLILVNFILFENQSIFLPLEINPIFFGRGSDDAKCSMTKK